MARFLVYASLLAGAAGLIVSCGNDKKDAEAKKITIAIGGTAATKHEAKPYTVTEVSVTLADADGKALTETTVEHKVEVAIEGEGKGWLYTDKTTADATAKAAKADTTASAKATITIAAKSLKGNVYFVTAAESDTSTVVAFTGIGEKQTLTFTSSAAAGGEPTLDFTKKIADTPLVEDECREATLTLADKVAEATKYKATGMTEFTLHPKSGCGDAKITEVTVDADSKEAKFYVKVPLNLATETIKVKVGDKDLPLEAKFEEYSFAGTYSINDPAKGTTNSVKLLGASAINASAVLFAVKGDKFALRHVALAASAFETAAAAGTALAKNTNNGISGTIKITKLGTAGEGQDGKMTLMVEKVAANPNATDPGFNVTVAASKDILIPFSYTAGKTFSATFAVGIDLSAAAAVVELKEATTELVATSGTGKNKFNFVNAKDLVGVE